MRVEELSRAIEKELTLLQESSTNAVKQSIKETARETRDEIKQNAPKGRTGKYARSWRTKTTEETMTSISIAVHAGNGGYQLAHLLEFGHAKRGGGRTKAKSHIKPAEEHAAESIEMKVRSRL